MKKILIVITAIVLILACSCSSDSDKGDAVDSPGEKITTAPPTEDDAEISVTDGETATAESGETGAASSDGGAAGGSNTVTSGDPVDATASQSESPTADNQNFIGVWATDELKTNEILIYEITEISVKFNTGISGLFGFDATAMLLGDEFIFGDGVSPNYGGPEGLRGKLKFSQNSITVTYEDFGSIPDAEYYPNEYTFTIKDENSEELVTKYRSTLK